MKQGKATWRPPVPEVRASRPELQIGYLRATDTQRDEVLSQLAWGFSAGALNREVFEARMTAATAAVEVRDLMELVSDLPRQSTPVVPAPRGRKAGGRFFAVVTAAQLAIGAAFIWIAASLPAATWGVNPTPGEMGVVTICLIGSGANIGWFVARMLERFARRN